MKIRCFFLALALAAAALLAGCGGRNDGYGRRLSGGAHGGRRPVLFDRAAGGGASPEDAPAARVARTQMRCRRRTAKIILTVPLQAEYTAVPAASPCAAERNGFCLSRARELTENQS